MKAERAEELAERVRSATLCSSIKERRDLVERPLTELTRLAKRGEQLIHSHALTVAKLREVCGDFGDNDWPDDLEPADIIEKHLARHLWAAQEALTVCSTCGGTGKVPYHNGVCLTVRDCPDCGGAK